MRAAKLLAHRMPVISVVRSRDHFQCVQVQTRNSPAAEMMRTVISQ